MYVGPLKALINDQFLTARRIVNIPQDIRLPNGMATFGLGQEARPGETVRRLLITPRVARSAVMRRPENLTAHVHTSLRSW